MVMIYTNYDRLVSFILHTKLLWKGQPVLEKKIFFKVFAIYRSESRQRSGTGAIRKQSHSKKTKLKIR